jgi:glycosyltransferase involved in cell wall biosynthesis
VGNDSTPASSPSVVIAHDFVDAFGGAERVTGVLAETFPDAPVWAIVGRSDVAERMGVADRFTSMLGESDLMLEHFRLLAPVYPAIVSARRLPEADVLLTSSFGFAHGLQTRNHAPQVCYCYSPLRFAWSMTDEYRVGMAQKRWTQTAFNALAAGMRTADRRLAKRVTRYVAESHYVADQIQRFYGRDADVIWPPVDCDLFRPSEQGMDTDEPYFLFCSRLVEPYKQGILAVQAFNRLPHLRLRIANDGPALSAMQQIAGPNVEFLGRVDEAELVRQMQGCAAVVFPSRDDFGLVPVETMACGRPAIAYGAGGALETVVPGVTGELFQRQDVDTLFETLESFDPEAYDPAQIRAHAQGWGVDRFRRAIEAVVNEVAANAA